MNTIVCEDTAHGCALAAALVPLWERGELVDFCVIVTSADGSVPRQELHAHRVVLAATCPYFATLFSCSLAEHAHHRVECELEAHLAATMPAFLRFLYTGSVSVLESELVALLALADRFHVRSLAEACASHLVRRVTEHNCFAMLHLADSLPTSGQVLRAPSMQLVLDHAHARRGCMNFFPAHLLAEVLRSHRLRVASEARAALIALDWLHACAPARIAWNASASTTVGSDGDVFDDARAAADRALVLGALRFACISPADWFTVTAHPVWAKLHRALCAAVQEQLAAPHTPPRRLHYAGALRLSAAKTPARVLRDTHDGAAVAALALCGAEQRYLVAGAYDKHVRVYDTHADLALVQTIRDEHTGAVYALAVDARGMCIFTGAADAVVRMYTLRVAVSPAPPPLSLPPRSGAATVACSSAPPPLALAHELRGHTLAVLCLTVLDDQHLASGSMDRSVRIWRVPSYAEHAAWTSDAGGAASAPSASAPHCTHSLIAHTDAVRALCVGTHARADLLFSGGYDRRIAVWRWRTGELLLKVATSGTVHSLSTLDAHRVLASTHDGALRVWRIADDAAPVLPSSVSALAPGPASASAPALVSATSAAPATAASATLTSAVGAASIVPLTAAALALVCERCVENTHGALPGTEAAWTTLVCGGGADDEPQSFVSGGLDRRVRVWDVARAHAAPTSHTGSNGSNGSSGSTAGRSGGVVSASSSAAVTLRAERALCGHGGGVLALAFCASLQTLCTGGQDGTIAVWR